MAAASNLRILLVHDWLTGMRGGEKCLEYFCQDWPDAPLYTLLHQRGSVSSLIENRSIHTSFLQWLPQVQRYYRYLLPLMPLAVRWRLPECDLVLSSSHCVAKGIQAPPGVPHVCYCFTPMRYIWHMREAYFGNARSGLKSIFFDMVLDRLRRWDRDSAQQVTHFVAISKTVQERIRDCYGRDSKVIYPPVDTDFYHPAERPRESYFLIVSAFAPYKRLDIAIEACNRLQAPLVIIGKGQAEKKLQQLAGPTVHFLGWQSNEVIREHMRRCRALLFPGEEDFGIVPLEAQACGTPVIAFGKGGATETVLPPEECAEPTGLWFEDQTIDSLVEALQRYEKMETAFDPLKIRRHAEKFRGQRFAYEIRAYVHDVLGSNREANALAA